MGVSIQNAMQYLSICKCDTGTPVQHAFPTRSTRESQGMEVGRVGIRLNDVVIVSNGARDPAYTEAAGQRAMAAEEILIAIDLARGAAGATVWTTDLSHDYVRINAEYRT